MFLVKEECFKIKPSLSAKDAAATEIYGPEKSPYSDTFHVVLLKWFADNKMKENTSKCHLLVRSGENVHLNKGSSCLRYQKWYTTKKK